MITKNSRKILIADDSLFFRVKLSDILMEAGHLLAFAKNGTEVIDEIKVDPNGIDLLLLDLQMPEIDGFGVLEWINANGYAGRFPVLALTGVHEASKVLDRLKRLGANGFMSKDLTPEEVVFRVNRLLFPEGSGRRAESGRVCSSIPVDFTVGGRTHTGFLLNLSEGGAFLHTSVRMEQGQGCGLRFSLPGSERVIHAEGGVRWLAGTPKDASIFCGYGMEFTLMAELDRKELETYVRAERARRVEEAPDTEPF